MKLSIRKNVYGVFGTAILLGALSTLAGTKEADAQIQFNINIGPPPIVVAEPADVVFIPGISVYFVPNAEFDLFFYNGYWWSPRGDRWYRATAYNGPWGVVNRRAVPGAVLRVPKNYRSAYKHEKHVPYGQLKKHGNKQEKKQDNKRGGKEEGKHGRGHGRGHDDD